MKKSFLLILAFILLSVSPAFAGGELYLYSWSDYTAPEAVKKFEAETGIKVHIDSFENNESLLAKLQLGSNHGYDVVVPTDFMAEIMIKEGLLEKINVQEMPNYVGLADRFKTVAWDPGHLYSAPYTYGTDGYAVDREVYKGSAESWGTVFNPPPELQGRVGVINDMHGVMTSAMIYKGIDLCSENPEDYKVLRDLLLAQKKYVSIYSAEAVPERVAAKEVDAYLLWSGDSLKARRERPSWTYVYPREGLHLWTDNLAVPKGARNIENAKIFINFMMRPDIAALTTTYTGYANPVPASAAMIDPETAAAPEMNIPEGIKTFYTPPCNAAARKLQDQVWTAVMR